MNEDRAERIAASLEDQFHKCRKEADTYLANGRNGEWNISDRTVDTVLKFVRAGVQLAGMVARLDAMKNRKSNPQ